ncbi:MAG: ribosome-associated ATPase/putative transporter RbbA [Lentisphaeria bacterium]|nr:ribosome-associated ATPase/putative transporter RbbA [Lentisphaeria bacterium]
MTSHILPLVKAERLTYRFGKVAALQEVSLELFPGELTALIGPDGVGKSTLLSLVSGARRLQKDGGLFCLGGNMREKRHRDNSCPQIAYMPQGLGKNLYFTLTVEENLQYFARLFGHDRAECRRRIDLLTASTGLKDFLHRPAGKLSGGMKQKLGLCCALIHDPQLLILDEPTTGVDPLARGQFWDLIDRIREQNPSMGVIAATAYMDEAARFDRLWAMDEGKILFDGTPADLFKQSGKSDLDGAFIQLLSPEKRAGHREPVLTPLPPDDQIAIQAHELSRKFGDFTAVDKVSFTIRRGEIFGFLGSNGCGKTTTMRMLTGLLEPSGGHAELFGSPVTGNTMEIRKHLGYMTQSFSLYNELTVKANLLLYARLCQLPEKSVAAACENMLTRFGLREYAYEYPKALPLGIKQRLSLAAAVIHQPAILILDEPTSGVDPVARDNFWQLIIELSRRDKVTIFITTHFMNEAMRCDRISLMHAGRSLACDTPQKVIESSGKKDLEAAFIHFLETASPPPELPELPEIGKNNQISGRKFSFQRLFACAWKENLELLRDPIRAALALFGALLLMTVMGYGISMDVEELPFAVLDRDNSMISRNYALNIAGSRYFVEKPPVKDYADLDRRMKNGELSMAVELPPEFGRELEAGRSPDVAVWVDGAMPMRSETINGYVNAMHEQWNASRPESRTLPPLNIEIRYRYNPDVRSLPAMVPGVIPILLIMLPATLAALAVVREKEMGSIINFYVTPLTGTEFLIGKQLPYIIFAYLSALLMVLMAVTAFDVPVKGSWILLLISLFLYCIISTGMGLLASSVTRSQIAVIFLTMLSTMLPATQLCGMINPVSTQQGLAKIIGTVYPTTYMLLICRGVFNKALGFKELSGAFLYLLCLVPLIASLGISCQRKQEK